MSRGWNYSSGDWLIICDSCARKTQASKSKQRWDGFIVCADCWEPRHSMDFIRVRPDKISVPFSRPRTVDVFNEVFGVADFISVEDSFSKLLDYSRDFSDSVTPTEVSYFDFGKSVTDSVTIADGLSLQSSAILGLTDTVTTSSSGDIFAFDYVDSTYVGLDYVGSSVGTIS